MQVGSPQFTVILMEFSVGLRGNSPFHKPFRDDSNSRDPNITQEETAMISEPVK